MFRKSMAVAALAVLFVCGGGAAAFAQDASGGPGSASSSAAGDANYTPRIPQGQPTLVGSQAAAMCVNDAAWISYRVALTDPDGLATSHEAKLVLSDGSHTYTADLGALVNDRLSGRILWPGMTVDGNGRGVTWPGWESVNGTMTQTGGNFGWTRGHITATLEVGAGLAVPLSYPKATPGCADPAAVTGASAAILPVTGLNVPVVPIAIGAFVVLLAGGGLLLVRRRRHS